MADIVKNVTIKFGAETQGLGDAGDLFDNINDKVKKTEKQVKDTNSSFKNFGGTILEIGAALGVAFSVGKIIDFGKESVKAFRESEEVAKKLEFAITRIGKEGTAAFERLTKQADKFSKITIFDDESIRKSQTQLVQFGLQSKEIEKLIPKILDLASATGQDLGQATDLVIQGINGQGRALKPYGIILDDTGSKTENLNILQEGLAKFAGSAGDAMETSAGKAKAYANEINELQESIGEKLAPTLDYLTKETLKGFEKELTNIGLVYKTFILAFGSDTKKFELYMGDFVNASTEAQTKIAFDLAKKGTQRTELEQKLFLEYRKILDAKLEASGDTTKEDLGLTQKGIDEKLAKEKKAFDDKSKAQKDADEKYKAGVRKLAEWESQHLQDMSDYENNLIRTNSDAQIEEFNATQNAILKLQEENAEKQKAIEEQKKQDKIDIQNAEFEFISQSANALFDYQNQLDEIQLQNAQQDLQTGILNQEEYDKRVAEIKTRQAKRDKEQAVFNIILSTAKAVIESLPNVVLAAIVGGIGAIQLAAVLARPIPKFAEGVIGLEGKGTGTSDSIPAMLSRGESVMTADETQKHKALLTSIRNDKLDAYLAEKYVNPMVNMKLKDIGLANNMAQSIKLQTDFPDEYALSRVMRRNKEVELGNADYLAQRIASEINKSSTKRTWN